MWRKAAFAEQDNRVRIPDGTAAVCAYGAYFDESQSLGKPGKAISIAVFPELQA